MHYAELTKYDLVLNHIKNNKSHTNEMCQTHRYQAHFLINDMFYQFSLSYSLVTTQHGLVHSFYHTKATERLEHPTPVTIQFYVLK